MDPICRLLLYLQLLMPGSTIQLPFATPTIIEYVSVIDSIPLHVKIAESFVGVKEKTGNNDGKEVEMFLRYVGRVKGDSWCAAFVSYDIGNAYVKSPTVRSGLARSFVIKGSVPARDVLIGKTKIPDGSLVIWRKGTTISGHIAIVIHWEKVGGNTIEGNTSSGVSGNQSDGDGVYKRYRTIQPANYFRITDFTFVKY